MAKVRWGVAGTGGIARRFAAAMQRVDGGSIVAVASRTREAAEEFAALAGATRTHVGYQSLAEDPDVDAVYVATPHSRHAADAILFLAAGKHVLCEKPMALDADQVVQMVDASRSSRVFLMEALWSRFLPAYVELRRILSEELIGEVRNVEASLGFVMPFDPTHRLFDRSMGGGALLDLGVYPLQLCSMVLGAPDRIAAGGALGSTGVDEHVAAVLHHEAGALGTVQAASRVNLRCDARIVGEFGVVELPMFMHCPDHLVLRTMDGVERIDAEWEGDGLRFQVEEVHRCLDDGRTESDLVPLEESIQLARTMDEIRAQIGVSYGDQRSMIETQEMS